jgi:hypothetical protein
LLSSKVYQVSASNAGIYWGMRATDPMQCSESTQIKHDNGTYVGFIKPANAKWEENSYPYFVYFTSRRP